MQRQREEFAGGGLHPGHYKTAEKILETEKLSKASTRNSKKTPDLLRTNVQVHWLPEQLRQEPNRWHS